MQFTNPEPDAICALLNIIGTEQNP